QVLFRTVPLTPSLLLCISLTFLSCLCFSPTDGINITAEPGQNVNLTCRAAKNGEVKVLKLIRVGLDPVYVLLYRNNRIDETVKNPQFQDRISLQYLSTADGEVNVTLSNVTENDSGTYLCKVMDKMYLQTINHLHVAREGECFCSG
uniref:Ig-like domain-containing protein n=1 Tax=Cyprinodon variegatus TaxID=28743 RepID=A0A3Q2CW09_CYPVA